LSWNAASGATSYNVKISTANGGPYTTITNVTATSFVDTGLNNGATYYYVVSSVGSVVESANSNPVSATPLSTSPPGIGNITISGSTLIINGTNGTAAASFYVLWSTNVALPLSDWTILCTNQFGPGGGFGITNAFNPSLQQSFYRIEVP
jgi:fibronectin type 3 domain-containing protein